MNDNIISPTFTNGITITIMAFVGITVVFLLAQGIQYAFGGNQ